jgi:hypothetical protein
MEKALPTQQSQAVLKIVLCLAQNWQDYTCNAVLAAQYKRMGSRIYAGISSGKWNSKKKFVQR